MAKSFRCEAIDNTMPIANGLLFIRNESINSYPLVAEDWPWIPFYMYRYQWERNIAVVKYTYVGVNVGQRNSDLNKIKCTVNNGQVFETEVVVKACPIGRFGRFCAERCQCFNGGSCHSFNGACRCAPGWTGRNCTTENPEVLISPSTSDLADLRYGQELQLTCTAYSFQVINITWLFQGDSSINQNLLNVTNYSNSSVLHISSLPEYEGNVTCAAFSTSGDRYHDTVVIRIAEPEAPGSQSQSTLLVISLSAAGLALLLLGAVLSFLIHRHKKKQRVGNIDDPEVFQLGKNLMNDHV
ncbi:uncharacterized protein [Branchiostoma lanceolatum]|uniref:uncharacterized protein n=1 Tax=Branchiostoma lanceolatum TaxID=7740 RepID=UPI00345329D0